MSTHVKLLGTIQQDREIIPAGETVLVSDADAKSLIARGIARPSRGARTDKQSSDE